MQRIKIQCLRSRLFLYRENCVNLACAPDISSNYYTIYIIWTTAADEFLYIVTVNRKELLKPLKISVYTDY